MLLEPPHQPEAVLPHGYKSVKWTRKRQEHCLYLGPHIVVCGPKYVYNIIPLRVWCYTQHQCCAVLRQHGDAHGSLLTIKALLLGEMPGELVSMSNCGTLQQTWPIWFVLTIWYTHLLQLTLKPKFSMKTRVNQIHPKKNKATITIRIALSEDATLCGFSPAATGKSNIFPCQAR